MRAPLYLRGLVLMLTVRACGGKCASVPRVDKGLTLRYPPHSGLVLGRGLRIGPGCMIECPPGALLSIGDGVGLTAGVTLSAHHEIVIGDNCLFAEWVSVRDGEHGTLAATTIASQPLRLGSVRIEDDVWVGRGSIVLQGTTLRRGCVLGANTFIKNKAADEFGIYVGTSPTKIKTRAR